MPHHDRNVMALCSERLKKADEDHGVAQHLIDENSIYLHAIAFHSQQAAEKYLKALLVYYQREFPKTHDIAQLPDILGSADKQSAEQLASLDELSPYAVESRYPGDMSGIDAVTAKSAVKLAKPAYNAAHGMI